MSKMTKSAKRLPILLVLLEHDAHPLNANRIRLLLRKMNMKVFGDDFWDASVSSGAVGKMCEDLKSVGLVESEMAKPPRRKQETSHYFLPLNDKEKMLRVTRLLLDKCGRLFVTSKYAKTVIDRLVIPAAENALGMKLDSSVRVQIKEICSASPGALRRVLDPQLSHALMGIATHNGENPSSNSLLEYLRSAYILDIADESMILEQKGRLMPVVQETG